MSVTYRNGIGFGTRSHAAFLDLSDSSAAAAAPSSSAAPAKEFQDPVPEDKTKTSPWALWGRDNKLPCQMANDIETCGVLNSGIDSKARFAIGRGLWPVHIKMNKDGSEEITDIVTDPKIVDWLEANNDFEHCFGWFKDFYGIGTGAVRFMLNRKRDQIAAFQRDDVIEMRYEKMDSKAHINYIYLSSQWDRAHNTFDPEFMLKIPLLARNNPLQDLEKRRSGLEFAMTFRYPSWNRKYYPMPLWYAAYKWVKIAQGVPDMKAALFNNSMRLKYMVIIYEGYWDTVTNGKWTDYTTAQREEKKEEVFDMIDNYLTGADNAYKSIFVAGKWDNINKVTTQDIEIKTIEDNSPQGEYLPDSAAANSEILFALNMNPAINGANMPSGPYTNASGGSNIREAVLAQIMIQEFERRQIARIFNVIKNFNGWDKTIQWRFLGNVMTTLDTGSSAKSVVSGGGGQPSEKGSPSESPK